MIFRIKNTLFGDFKNMREYYSRRHRLLGECDGDGDIQVEERLFPRLHTLFAYNFFMNGPRSQRSYGRT